MRTTLALYRFLIPSSLLLLVVVSFAVTGCTNRSDTPKEQDISATGQDEKSDEPSIEKDNRIWLLMLNIAQGIGSTYERDVVYTVISERLAIGGFLGDARKLADRIGDHYQKAQALSTIAEYFIIVNENEKASEILDEAYKTALGVDSAMDRLSLLRSIAGRYESVADQDKVAQINGEIETLRQEIRKEFAFTDINTDTSLEILDRIDNTTLDAEELIDMGEYERSLELILKYEDRSASVVALSYFAMIFQMREEQLNEDLAKSLDMLQTKYK